MPPGESAKADFGPSLPRIHPPVAIRAEMEILRRAGMPIFRPRRAIYTCAAAPAAAGATRAAGSGCASSPRSSISQIFRRPRR